MSPVSILNGSGETHVKLLTSINDENQLLFSISDTRDTEIIDTICWAGIAQINRIKIS